VSQFYDIDAANARLPELREIIEALHADRAELIGLRDDVLERQQALEGASAGTAGGSRPADPAAGDELRRLRLRMQGVIDRMQAGVARIDGYGITLRDIPDGLVDFPALVNGRQVCLCWKLGEDEVGFWHELDAGFGGRRPLVELE
jgi:hypothetical protein